MKIEKLPSWYFSKTNTNKASRSRHNFGYLSIRHDYSFLYDTIILSLVALKQSPLKVLELGVSMYGYGSGHAFSEMPYVGKFVGVDIAEPVTSLGNGNIFVHADTDTMDCINKLKFHAPFDLIVHDANHTPESQIFFFQNYSRLLAKPGYMVCEDVEESDRVLRVVKDSNMHLINVPPVEKNFGTCLVKFNIPSFSDTEYSRNQVFPVYF